MRFKLPIILLGAACCMFSGCGCSKEKSPPSSEAEARMQDAAYTNRLVQIHKGQKAAASKSAAIRAEIERLGANPESRPEYADLTNRLAQCELEAEAARNAARNAVRERIMKDAAAKKAQSTKGNLNK